MHGFTCYHEKESFIEISPSTRWKHSQCGCIYHITLTMYMNNDDLHTTVTSTCFLINQDSSDATLLPSKQQPPNSFDPHQQPYHRHSNISHENFHCQLFNYSTVYIKDFDTGILYPLNNAITSYAACGGNDHDVLVCFENISNISKGMYFNLSHTPKVHIFMLRGFWVISLIVNYKLDSQCNFSHHQVAHHDVCFHPDN